MHRYRGIAVADLLRTVMVALPLLIVHLPASAQENQQQLLSEWACHLDGNDTLKLGFYASVRRLYGDNGNPEDDGKPYTCIHISAVINTFRLVQICTVRFEKAWQTTFVAMEAARAPRSGPPHGAFTSTAPENPWKCASTAMALSTRLAPP